MRTALLGTGTMGAGMARSLQRGGHDVVAWNRSRDKAAPLAEDGIEVADTIADAVRGAEVVITMLFDADSVLDHTPEILDALGDDAIWVQSSTVGPDGIERIAAAAPNARLIDAPVLGTKQPAEQGKLTVLASGPGELIDAARPVFEAIGAKTVRAGDELGQASALKLACNAWILSITAAAAQSLALAAAQGVAPELFLEAISGAPADSPYAQMKGKAMLAGEFEAAFAIDGGRKDLELIRTAARSHGVPDDVLTAVIGRYDAASAAGHGDDDLAAVHVAFASD